MSTASGSMLSLTELRRDLDGMVIGPEDGGYDEARQLFTPLVDRRPAAIVRPRDAEGVAYVVSLAHDTGIELAVRGGGHSYAGHSVTDGGILLDLSLMKSLVVDSDGRTASAEAGLTTGEVTRGAAEHGLGVSFGDTASVGIGGLTLGGGVGYMVRKHGLTIDSLIAAEVVTADGHVRRVDDEHEPDLFWAIRGGGGNFGVATRFHYRLHPVDSVTGGMLILPATAETIEGFVAAAEAAPEELSSIANVMTAPPMPFIPSEHHGKLVVLAMLVHVGPGEAGERALAPFRELATPLADMLRPMSFPEIYPPEDPDYRPLATARTTFMDNVDRDAARHMVERLGSSSAQMAVTQLRVLGGAMARVPSDATAFAHRSREIMAMTAAMFATPEELPAHEAWAEEFAGELRQSDAGAYVNFLADEGEERVRAAYPGETWDRLTEIKRRYDPDNVFHLNQNVPPGD